MIPPPPSDFVARRSMASAASKSAAPLTFDRYPFLRELGLAPENAGVFNGTWGGSGDWFTSVNPATNEPIARVRGGTVAECVDLRVCLFFSPRPPLIHLSIPCNSFLTLALRFSSSSYR